MTIRPLAFAIMAVAISLVTFSANANDPKPLFASEDIINIEIRAPFKTLIRQSRKSKDPFDAQLVLDGAIPETHDIILSPRGKSRRREELCNFPPLRVTFPEKPDAASLFKGQKGVKLVTHCKKSISYQQYYLLEYTGYKLLNELTPMSHKVRLAKVHYVESETGKTIITRHGFFIEDTDDVAKRNGVKEIDVEDINVDQLNRTAAARHGLFQYMIGNLDWSMHNGPDGDDCCHNTKLIGDRAEPMTNLVPVAYDFDYSGLVDAPYAAPPASVNIESVRKRRYRGFCRHDDVLQNEISHFRAKKTALLAVVDNISPMEKRTRSQAKKYIEGFYKSIATDKKIKWNLESFCRN